MAVPLLVRGAAWLGETANSRSAIGQLLWAITLGFGIVTYTAFAWRVTLWRRYRPMESVADECLPFASVIIPAFNEGPLVRQAIMSAAVSRYPRDRFEIIAIDDGSDDDTWAHMLAAASDAPPGVKIKTLRQPRNTGKRQALCRGFRMARGDVFVTLDSDSILAQDALRNAVTPLVREPDIGCVAGCVEVLNPSDSVFTRFLKTTFSLSFKFVRAYQNEFRGVFCTPGALSVYRADVVRKLAPEWADQTFLGRTCTTGEDRAMTNLFLREGWLTAYQQNAVVRARMPHTYRGLTAMFLRWARSNLRETWVLWRFLWTPFRRHEIGAFRLNMVLATLALILPSFMILGGLRLMWESEAFIWRQLALMVLWSATSAIIYYRNERDRDWIYLFGYQIFWVTCLSWIIPYAAATIGCNDWLTRRARQRSYEPPSDPARPVFGHVDAAADAVTA